MKQLGFDWHVETKHEREWRENIEKGLSYSGYTLTFDGESRVFYLNGIEITCSVSYKICGCPHVEFHGEPSYLTSTGYYSHFDHLDYSVFSTFEDMVRSVVAYRLKQTIKKVLPYTLEFRKEL